MADGVAATAVWQIRIRPNWDWVGMTGEHGADAEGLPIAHGYNFVLWIRLGLGGDGIICLECSDVRWQNISF